MDEEIFKEQLRCIRNELRAVDTDFYASLSAAQIAGKMEELAGLIDGYLNESDYTQDDFADDMLTVMEFLASDEVARFSEGSDLQLSMLQTALLNYVDSLNCFDVAQED